MRPSLLGGEPDRALLDVALQQSAHPLRHVAEGADLQGIPDLGQRRVEIALANPLHGPGQGLERPRDPTGEEPDQAEGQRDHAEPDQQLALGEAAGAGDQLVAGRGQEQRQRLAGVRLDRALHADPRAPLQGEGGAAVRRDVGGEERGQRAITHVAGPLEPGPAAGRGANQPVRLGMRDHEPLEIDQGDLGGRGDPRVGELAGECPEGDVRADHGRAVGAPLRERRADLAGREEHVRARSHRGGARVRLLVPAARPRIEAVVGPGLVLDHGQRLIQEAIPTLSAGAALDEEVCSRWRAQVRRRALPEGADEEEVPVREAHVDRRDVRLLGEGGGEEGQGLETGLQCGGPRDPVSRQQLDQQARRSQQVPDLPGRALRHVQELLVARREQEPGGGQVSVAHDGQAGREDQGDEERGDVNPERERPPPPVVRGRIDAWRWLTLRL